MIAAQKHKLQEHDSVRLKSHVCREAIAAQSPLGNHWIGCGRSEVEYGSSHLPDLLG